MEPHTFWCAISLLISWYFWIFSFSLSMSAILASPGTAMSITMYSFSFLFTSIMSGLLAWISRSRLNGKVPQEFYVSSFDNPVLACTHTIFLRYQVHTVSRLPSSKSWQRCHAGACIAFVPSYCIHTARGPPSRLSHSIFYIKERAAVSRFLFWSHLFSKLVLGLL